MKIRSGNYDILISGIVTSFRNDPVEFILNEEGPPLVVRFAFVFDKSAMRVEGTAQSDHEVTLTFFGIDREVASGSAEPLPIGTMNDRHLYLNYRIYSLGENSQLTIHYTWYLGGRVEDGG
jgi:hypothetical protein